MNIVCSNCAGLDVHKRTVVACRITRAASGERIEETCTFSTMTGDLLRMSDWLEEGLVAQVAMESTGEYWKPVYNILEDHFELLVVNASHIKNVPGRKTDVKDAQWIAQLLEVGLLRPSFVPPAGQRELRDLTRHRSTFARERATLCNRIQKVLETANIKLASVATNVLGASGRAMLKALASGETDGALLADLALGRLRSKREQLEQALIGRFGAHHRLILSELLIQVDSLDESIARFDAAIEERCAPFEDAVEVLNTIPGVGRTTAEIILAEVGVNLDRFPTAGHLAAWAGVAPGNHESGGRRLSGRIRQGNLTLRSVLVQAAHAASRTKGTYLSALFQRLSARRGRKRAIMAVAHSILVSVYYMLTRGERYRDLGHDYLDRLRPEKTKSRLVGRLEAMGYLVSLQPKEVAVA